MQPSDVVFSKRRWLLNAGGLAFYVLDICTDVALAVQYFEQKQYVWSGMTVMFVMAAVVVTQIFSCAWYWEDKDENNQTALDMSKRKIAVLHVFVLGINMRYYYLLKEGFSVCWKTKQAAAANIHHKLFWMATDLSMLKLFETFLESAPQLLLQLYIRGYNEWPLLQIFSLAFSFCNIAWSLVDYWHCLRKSLPNVKDKSSRLPTAVYLIYKVCTITSIILSYSLYVTLSIYSTVGITIIWLLGTTWVHLLQTNFCSSRCLELLYRAVVGVILIFSFFNAKGKNTKEVMVVYYVFYSLVCVTAPLLLAFLKPEMRTAVFLWTVGGLIYGGLLFGLLSLHMYYRFLHPPTSNANEENGLSNQSRDDEADEVDGPRQETITNKRLKTFLQP
ncbi:XK-related protein 9 isoform X1 [Nothobranchius furzeri]|uniref:XK-related protein n=1 Tax=Nothobranchius furzeri TaxID=105023 RepID=A0A8C6NS85_NOTFU|nr:transcript variant X1 [Nothobranchius furzeri]